MPASLSAFHNTPNQPSLPPPNSDICSANARARSFLGSVHKPPVVRARISVSQPLLKSSGLRGGSWHRDQGLRPSLNLRIDPSKHSGWVLPSDVPPGSFLSLLKGSGASCSSRACRGHCTGTAMLLCVSSGLHTRDHRHRRAACPLNQQISALLPNSQDS